MDTVNGKMEFFYQFRDGDGSVKITLPADATLEEALEGFETFLLAAGYSFEGQVEINGNIDPDAKTDYDLSDPNAERN